MSEDLAGRFYRDEDGCIGVTFWDGTVENLRVVYVHCAEDGDGPECVGRDYAFTDRPSRDHWTEIEPVGWQEVTRKKTFEFGDRVLVQLYGEPSSAPRRGRYVAEANSGEHGVYIPELGGMLRYFNDDNIELAD
jgi:hypothetical protein